jgi:hypothetical protein
MIFDRTGMLKKFRKNKVMNFCLASLIILASFSGTTILYKYKKQILYKYTSIHQTICPPMVF